MHWIPWSKYYNCKNCGDRFLTIKGKAIKLSKGRRFDASG
jgi:hypothetical protein